MNSVRLVTFGGEPFFGSDVRRRRPMFRPDAELRNRLGAAEVGVVCEWVTTADDEVTDTPVPIGHAQPGIELRVVDDNGDAVPRGETGLLLVLDDNLSPGYWPTRSSPASASSIFPTAGAHFARATSYAVRADGAIEHVGRADDRVKVHRRDDEPERGRACTRGARRHCRSRGRGLPDR